MSFPLSLPGRVVPDAPSLAALVRDDAGATAGTVFPGQRPSDWLPALVATGQLERRLAIGLAAALVQNPEAATVCEGARLAERLGERVLGGVLLRALAAHDTGLLLQRDPARDGSSVEDTLLAGCCRLADLADPEVRRPLLERLRNAGLPELELGVLLSRGDADDLERWLPAVLAEDVPDALRAAVELVRGEGSDRSAVVARLFAKG